jgi:hypothetical protein
MITAAPIRAGSPRTGHRHRAWATRPCGRLSQLSGPGLPRGHQLLVPSSIQSGHCPCPIQPRPASNDGRGHCQARADGQIAPRHAHSGGRHRRRRSGIREGARSSAGRRSTLDNRARQPNGLARICRRSPVCLLLACFSGGRAVAWLVSLEAGCGLTRRCRCWRAGCDQAARCRANQSRACPLEASKPLV